MAQQQEQEERAKTVLIIEIDKMNAPIETKSSSRKRTREEIFDEYEIYFTVLTIYFVESINVAVP